MKTFDSFVAGFRPAFSIVRQRITFPLLLLTAGLLLVQPCAGQDGTWTANGTWSATGSLATARYIHTATLLPNGKVLVAGGVNGGASAELYDPVSGTWTMTGSTALLVGQARCFLTSTGDLSMKTANVRGLLAQL
jgi:hypothetical protein